ncbi:uncharacterized protein AKAW2_81340S [Aspergillus luchuensis]|uniref:Uncharacterized protein n=1 Tax=Aspergillus kawachii TaxID=1069201 RepID=A0A7R7WM98_ASPKA|nr:uncharacterized protein AKAW2_81340S [Aspergillus luchuensis]BCS05539.1 hypothetical protein AKAW2_81340S [Aspergillus luchuensis]
MAGNSKKRILAVIKTMFLLSPSIILGQFYLRRRVMKDMAQSIESLKLQTLKVEISTESSAADLKTFCMSRKALSRSHFSVLLRSDFTSSWPKISSHILSATESR